jgi:signal transduction histidine kinase
MASANHATVLVVDDNEANRALAQAALEDEGYAVLLANNGEEGVNEFTRSKPDCILLDVRMPGMDGFTACARIRELPGGAEVPILFLTALRDVDTFDSALRAGGDDFLTKPVRPNELLARVEAVLKVRRMRAELREHYAVLKQQRDDLLRLSLQKERLMAFVVHDLKNPVNAMDLHAQVLLRDKTLSDRARSSATQIRNEARTLTRMILNLLDLSKGDEGKLTAARAPIDVETLVGETLAELEVAAQARDVALASQLAQPTLHGDRDLLRRTLANLVENAIRHAPAKTTVTVSSRRVASTVELRVADQGTGIPENMRERVFDPFLQLGSESGPSSRSGRGLGLAFCNLVASAHHGRIWVEDGAPGAVFVLSIPDE